jgi:serine/threonine protein kinase/WD40 repeat protein
MSEPQSCPDSAQLHALIAGSAAPADQERLSRHVEQCDACQRTLEQLAATSWDDKARRFGAPEAAPPVLQEVIRQAQAQGTGPETLAVATSDSAADRPAGADDLSYLAPPAQPGNLGRLDHYEVLAVIGKGGFGTVFKARDEKLDRLVAIKVLTPALAGSGTARRRFIREAKAAAALRNDHVIAIHGVSDTGPVPYLVMELISGVSLQDKLDAKGPLEVKEILRIGMQIAHGLAAAHKQGLVHRDIKPANILLENGVERVKITDFGLARAVDDASVTQSGTVAGTPMYMSPEQAEGLPVDHRSDLFSLGTVLYAMATGHPPFRASGTHAVLKRVIDASPRPIREINSDIPDWLEAIVAKLHAKKPEERFPTAQEVADLLGQYLAHIQQPQSVPKPAPLAAPCDTVSATDSKPPPAVVSSYWPALIGLVLGAAVGLVFPELMPSSESARANLIGWIRSLVQGGLLGAGVGLLMGTALKKSLEILLQPQNGTFPSRSRRWALAMSILGFLVAPSLMIVPPFLHIFNIGGDWSFPWAVHTVLFGAAGIAALAALLAAGLAWQRRKPLFGSMTCAFGFVAAGLAMDGYDAWQRKARFFVRADDPEVRVTLRSDSGAVATVLAPGAYVRLPAGTYEVEVVCGRGSEIRSVFVFEGRGRHHDLEDPGIPVNLQLELERDQSAGLMIITAPQSPPAEPGWTPLFNGEDLTGWKPLLSPNVWQVQDRLLVGGGGKGYLVSEREYENFHFRVEAKFVGDMDSGQWFRFNPALNHAYEAQIGGVRIGDTGTLLRIDPTGPVMLFRNRDQSVPPDTWLTQEVIANGKHLRVRLNGQDLASVVDDRYRRGHLALQSFNNQGTVYFRKIEVKELPPSEPGPRAAIVGKPLLRKTIDNKSLVRSLAFTPGNTLIVGGDQLNFFDPVSGDLLHQEKLNNHISSPISLSRDGRTLVAVDKDAALVMDLPNRRIPLQSKIGFVFSAALSPDGKTLVYNADKTLWLYDRATGKTSEGLRGQAAGLFALKYSPDGRFLVGTGAGNLVILDGTSVNKVLATKPMGGVTGLTDIAQDSTVVAVSGGHNGKPAFFVVRLADQELLYQENNLSGTPGSVALSPDGTYLALGMALKGAVQIWDLRDKKLVASWDAHPGAIFTGVAFSPDGKTLATGGRSDIKLWDLQEQPGWVKLFNGKDLTGWKSDLTPGVWGVQDGILRGRWRVQSKVASMPKSHLESERGDFQDFHLHVQARISDGGNSGVCFRGDPTRRTPSGFPEGYEAPINSNHSNPIRTGSLFHLGLEKAVKEMLVPPDVWFDLDVIAQDNHLQIKVNGKTTVDHVDEQRTYMKGHFALELVDPRSVVEFRKIEIKELSPQTPK